MRAPIAAGLDWARREIRVGFREWHRARVAHRRTRHSRQTYVLATVWVGLLVIFGLSLAYLAPPPAGMKLTIDKLSALAGQHRIVAVSFHDEDAQIVGTFSC